MIASMMEVPGLAMRITKSAATGLAYNSAHRADIFHSTVSATNRDHQERGKVQRKKIRTEFSRNRPSMVCHRCGRKEISLEGLTRMDETDVESAD